MLCKSIILSLYRIDLVFINRKGYIYKFSSTNDFSKWYLAVSFLIDISILLKASKRIELIQVLFILRIRLKYSQKPCRSCIFYDCGKWLAKRSFISKCHSVVWGTICPWSVQLCLSILNFPFWISGLSQTREL